MNVLIFFLFFVSVISVTVDHYGGGYGDSVGPFCDDCSVMQPLGFSFKVMGQWHSNVVINSNGAIQFGGVYWSRSPELADEKLSDQSYPTVAGYWKDLNSNFGTIYHRYTTSSSQFSHFLNQIPDVTDHYPTFSPDGAIVVTYHSVRNDNGNDDEREHTFQIVVLAEDSGQERTIVIFNYEKLEGGSEPVIMGAGCYDSLWQHPYSGNLEYYLSGHLLNNGAGDHGRWIMRIDDSELGNPSLLYYTPPPGVPGYYPDIVDQSIAYSVVFTIIMIIGLCCGFCVCLVSCIVMCIINGNVLRAKSFGDETKDSEMSPQLT